MENIIENTVLYCLTSFYWNFPINNDGIGLSISKLTEKTILHISNTFFKVSLKLKQVNNYSCNRENNLESLFLYDLTKFHWTLPNKIDGFGWPLSKLRESTLLLHMANIFLEVFLKFKTKLKNFKQVDSDSCIMGIILEIIVFHVFGNLLVLNIALKLFLKNRKIIDLHACFCS